ncbi:uncharacterized protein [Dendrobates tinctorius]|uniref:uncharacterized protein isoform X2 n=1 Tax=Dendrobates tinctorius TaxID=92724 RepID=UPI003CC94672
MRFSILIFCCLHGTCWTSHYCVYQPKTLSAIEGDSVTVPCSYTYPEYIKESQIRVTWGERGGLYCDRTKKPITDNSGNIIYEYEDQISIVKPPDNNRTEYLIIRGVKASDGITFCCRVTELSTSGTDYSFYSFFGTSLTIADKDKLSQMEELMAVFGEEMIIPCHYSIKMQGKAQKVSWYTGDYNRCYYSENDIIYTWDRPLTYDRYSLVSFPEDVSLRVHHVLSNENFRICCLVTTSNGTMESTFGTELTIAGPPSSSPFTVTQPRNITSHRGESVTLNCTYNRYKESDVLGVRIYWRAGNISGPYVYHPYKNVVHSSYKGRTEIKGAADLHIRGLQVSDDSVYYCFVMIRLCVNYDENPKLVQYGEGTRLIVTEPPNDLGETRLMITVFTSAAVLLVLLCVIFVLLKKREEISLEERPYCEISTKNTKHDQAAECEKSEKEMMAEKEIDDQENILYSELNKTKLQEGNPSSYQTQQEQIVYAAVIRPDGGK